MMIKDRAIELARELVAKKVPFLHQGRTDRGIDCVGLLCYAYQYHDHIPDYPRDPVNGELERALKRVIGKHILERPIKVEDLREADILSMQYAGPVRHVAIVANHPTLKGQLSIIHIDAMIGRAVEHILDKKWVRRIVKVWRL